MKIHPVAYCFRCKKWFDEDLTDGQGFICCPNCTGAYRYNVIQLKYNENDKYWIEEQDEFMISFRDEKDFDKLIKIMKQLIKRAKLKQKEEGK